MKITNFNIEFNKENVLKLIDCYENSPIYDEVVEEYEDMLEEAYERVNPRAVFEMGILPAYAAGRGVTAGEKVIYLITTVGGDLSQWSTSFFEEGNYLRGMLADAMADDYLFQASESVLPIIKEYCLGEEKGIKRRVEAPGEVPMEAQRAAFEGIHADETLGIGITSSYMYDPVKTSCQIFVLQDQSNVFHMDHNCRECPNRGCKMRTPLEIKIEIEGQQKIISTREESSLLEILQKENLYIPAICAGRGVCGKCAIQLLEGHLKVTKADESFFTLEQLEQGFRLSCMAYPSEDIRIKLQIDQEEEMEILGGNVIEQNHIVNETNHNKMIAVDIGTTTIAMELIQIEDGTTLDSFLTINKQRQFGADVISRIQASVEGKGSILRESICKQLYEGIEKLTKQGSIQISKLVIAGNTTMLHLLLGYPCDTLGVYPFIPHHIDSVKSTGEVLWRNICAKDYIHVIPVFILPGISAFVGADIVSDMLITNMAEKKQVSMLIDLGTNGEMTIGNEEQILVTSTAAGPAFEGGNIVHGTGSIPGAICDVKIDGKENTVETILGQPPIGICGTGAIAVLSELLRNNYIDETGLLDDAYLEDGYALGTGNRGEICFYQKDIRELQLAKSAVRAGIETLLLRFGIKAGNISKVYLAGGFGYHINVTKAIAIGLLPEVFRDKIEIIGNGSLKGATLYGTLTEEIAEKKLKQIISISKEINLSADKDFNNFYMEHMYFDNE